MSSSRKVSPARSQGVRTLNTRTTRRSHSVCSARSNTSVRLSTLISDSFKLTPIKNRRSVLNDDTDIDIPGRKSWWKKLGENSRDVMDVLEDKDIAKVNNVAEEFDVEILSQEKKNYSIDLPESSDGESINSIVIPQRKLFTQKENQAQKKFGHIIDNRETLAKLQKSHIDEDREIKIAPKNLFNQASRPRTKPAFPAALLNISSKAVNKTKEMPTAEVKGQVRNLFGNRPGSKRKNMFADFIVSESEDEIPEIQPKVFGFEKSKGQKRRESSASRGLPHSPTSSIDLEMDEWKLLPSSTMVENQLEDAGTPVKRAKLSKLSEAKEFESTNSSVNKTKQSNNSIHSKNKSKNSSKSKVKDVKKLNLTSESNNENIQKTNQVLDQSNNVRLTRNKSKSLRESISNDNDHSKINNKSINTLKSMQSVSDKVSAHEKGHTSKEQIENNMKTDIIQTEIHNISPEHVSNDDEDFTLEYENDDEQISQPTLISKTDNAKENENELIEANNIKSTTLKEQLSKPILSGIDKDVLQQNTSEEEKIHEKSKTQEHVDKHNEKQINPNNQNLSMVKNSDKEIVKELRKDKINQSKELMNLKKSTISDPDMSRECETINMHGNKHKKNSPVKNVEIDHENLAELNNSKNEKHNEITESKHTCDKNRTQNENERDISQKNEENVNIDEEFVEEEEEVETNQTGNDDQNDSDECEPEESVEIEDKTENNQTLEQNDSDECEPEESVEAEDEIENNETLEQNDSDECENEESIEAEEEMEIDQTINEEQNDSGKSSEHEVEDDIDEREHANSDDQGNSDSEGNQNETEEQLVEETDIREEQNESETDDLNESENQEDSDDVESDSNLQNESKLSQNENIQEEEELIESDLEESDNVDNEAETAHDESDDHDTTGRHRKKNITTVKSPEVILHNKINEMESFTAKGRNTSIRKTKSIIKNINIRPSLAPVRESTGISEGTRDSSEEGSGWDSHRTTRKTIRLTLGKDFTPRKSLRALVMEKSAKRNTNYNEVLADNAKLPQANSTELHAFDSYQDTEPVHVDETVEEPSGHEVSTRTKQTTLELYLQKIKQENLQKKLKMEEEVRASLKAPSRNTFNSFKIPQIPVRRTKQVQKKPKPKQIKSSLIPLNMLPPEVLEDMKYKPPKRFQPSNASWITKRLYKFLESKLEPKYDYKARVRAERVVQQLHALARQLRRGAADQALDALRRDMARLDIVKTHFEFYEFFHEFMPREIRVKVVPDVVNKISLPKHGVFSDIMQ